MKYFLQLVSFSLLFLLFSCEEPVQTQQKKKPVRATNIAKYTAVYDEERKEIKKGEFDETHMMQFTYFHENGTMNKKYWYDKNKKVVYTLEVKRNYQGKDSVGVIKNDKLVVQSRIKYTLNAEGNKVEEEYRNTKGALTKTKKFQYDSNGNIVKEIELDKSGKTKLTTAYILNEKGDIAKMNSFTPDGSYKMEENYEFQLFNDSGDWTQKQVVSDGVVTHIINRKINYHGEKKK